MAGRLDRYHRSEVCWIGTVEGGAGVFVVMWSGEGIRGGIMDFRTAWRARK